MRKVKGILPRDKEERNFLHAVKGRKANWIGDRMSTNCRLKTLLKGR